MKYEPSTSTAIRYTKAFGRKVDAERWLTTQEADQLQGQWSDPRAGRIRFEEQATRWAASRRSQRPTTLARDESLMGSLVLPTFGRMPLSSITTNHVEKRIAGLVQAGYSPATVRKAYQIFGGVIKSAIRARRIGFNVAIGISLPELDHRERRFLTTSEILALAEAIDPRYRLMVLLGGFAGLRFGEVAALRASSLGIGMRTITVRETITEVSGKLRIGPPKTRASIRTVALPRFLSDELVERVVGKGRDELLFTAPMGGMVSPNRWRQRVWKPAAMALGLDDVTFHALRHSQGALLVQQGEHPLVVARRLGHTSVRTVLDIYGHLFEGIDQQAADRLDESVRSSSADQVRTKPTPEVVDLLGSTAEKP
ncbi:MAG TPA: tyrosine-type recombinase/integrase [Acidimicrobiia bacterium]|nr:tyrosine-type recombinase/integrase [Acidimicrobiia bacterium]